MTMEPFYVYRSKEARSRMRTFWHEGERPEDHALVVVSNHGNARDIDGAKEITYDQERVREWFDESIPDIVLDILEIALATFAIDKSLKRRISISADDTNARINTRNISLTIPTLSPQLPTDRVEKLLSQTVSHTTRDIIQYDLRHQQIDTPSPYTLQDGSIDTISLFSGGLDSTSGIFHNQEHNIKASYVSLNYGSGIGPLTDNISDKAGIERTLVGIEYKGKALEPTQFSRGFLHFVFGVAAALGKNAQTVQCFENGIIARFIILQDGWLTTRTTSPTLIHCLNSFLDEIDIPITVQNPFENNTKTEVVNHIPDTDIISETITCPHTRFFNNREQDNCGLCVQCILRTISIIASKHAYPIHDINIHNPFLNTDFKNMTANFEVKTSINHPSNAVSPDVFLNAVSELAYFSRLLLKGEASLLAEDYPKLYDPTILALHRRFATEFKAATYALKDHNTTVTKLI